jgi:PPOX class probable F420-dependent enzyme
MFDQSNEFGARVARRLKEERIIWLVTIDRNQTPQPSPVWFYWDGESFLIYSRPDQPKLRNIADNPKVSLHFDGDGRGSDIVIFTGEAHIDESAPPANKVDEYAAKYRDGIMRIKMTPDSFAAAYSIAIRVKMTKLRGH